MPVTASRVGRRAHGMKGAAMVRFSVKALLLVLLALSLMLGIGSMAFAASWPDLESGILMAYGLTTDQVLQVSVGYPDGTWQPWRPVDPGAIPQDGQDRLQHRHCGSDGRWLHRSDAPVTRLQAIAVLARLVATGEGYDLKTMSEGDVTAALARVRRRRFDRGEPEDGGGVRRHSAPGQRQRPAPDRARARSSPASPRRRSSSGRWDLNFGSTTQRMGRP